MSGHHQKKSSSPAKEPWAIVEASFALAAHDTSQVPAALGVEVAFAGRSNVGKSSLMNVLLDRRRLVRTSSTPGCTRQLSFFKARARDGAVFQLVDLPGYGYAKRSKKERAEWARLIEAYLGGREWLRAVVLLIDARRGLDTEEQRLIEFIEAAGGERPAIIPVATKLDKIPRSKRKAALGKLQRSFGSRGVIGASAITGKGVAAIWQAIRKACFIEPSPSQS